MTNTDAVSSILILANLLLAFALMVSAKIARVVPGPTVPRVRKKVMGLFLEIMPPSSSTKKIAELGCGWGGMVIALAKQYPEAIIDGYEISPIPYLVAKLRSLPYRGRVRIYAKNFLTVDLTEYQGIFTYLVPCIMADLSSHLKGCPEGITIIASGFPLPDWPPLRTDEVRIGTTVPIYCYKTPSPAKPVI